jgi:hypothetical protein
MNDNEIKQAIESKQSKLFEVIASLDALASDECPDNASKMKHADALQSSIDALSRTLDIRADAKKYHAWK